MSIDTIVAVAFGLAGTILSIGAIYVTMKQRYIRIYGKPSEVRKHFGHDINIKIEDFSDLERQQRATDTEPPHAAAIRLLEIVSALVSVSATMPNASHDIRSFIELEDQPSRG